MLEGCGDGRKLLDERTAYAALPTNNLQRQSLFWYLALEWHRISIKMAPSGTIKTVLKADHFRWTGVVGSGRWLAGLARLKGLSTSRAEFAIVRPRQGRLSFHNSLQPAFGGPVKRFRRVAPEL